MPETGAIMRVREAMDVWLTARTPDAIDFRRLRADLNHILSCIPGDPVTTTEDGAFQWTDGPDHVRVACTQCGWDKTTYGTRMDAVRLVEASETHRETQHNLTVLRTAPQRPYLGETVHYRSYGTPGGEYTPQCRAAVITDVHGINERITNATGMDIDPRETVALTVFNPDGTFLKRGIHHDESQSGGTWHWPCQ